ncbi:MAG: hypothetical protein ACWGO1_06985 [Anaerolineales bacterium]
MLKPSSGHVTIGSMDVVRQAKEVKHLIGCLGCG